ncbi:MAG TPA: type II toxin-antitoxin system VapC family toxin [Kiritimatiellia bacterium]|nr:type II toxin-antitoxin system VapC family toxin [Kiritimatiellia bacterium]
MRYWDASGIVPLLVEQSQSREMEKLIEQDPDIVTWWGTSIECFSALMRLVREGRLNSSGAQAAERRLRELRKGWNEVLPTEACRRAAERMLRVHPLRTADAQQLAAALIASDNEPSMLEVVCLDQRLTEALRKEGFIG